MNSENLDLILNLLQALGKISEKSVARLLQCSKNTGISPERILLMCGTLSDADLSNATQAANSLQDKRSSYLKTLLILRQAMALGTSFDTLINSQFYKNLNPLAIWLLSTGNLGLSQIQRLMHKLDLDTTGAPREISGLTLYSNKLIDLEIWRQAIIDLRLLQTGKLCPEQLDGSRCYPQKINLNELFCCDTWLLSPDCLCQPDLLHCVEDSICLSTATRAKNTSLNIVLPKDMQKLIVVLKMAMHSGKLNQIEATRVARQGYLAPEQTAVLANLISKEFYSFNSSCSWAR
jgi:hypothetical protein